jgi:transcriptional regulator with XRE-family HTH domain
VDQRADNKLGPQRAEAEKLWRTRFVRDMPWLTEWQTEEILQRELDKWFGPNADPEIAERFLDRARLEQEQKSPQNFGSWLREQIQLRGWSQSDLARRIESHPSLVSKWVRGLQLPQPRQCARLALAFNIDSTTVLEMAGHVSPHQFEFFIHDVLADSPVRHEILQLLNEVPEPLLVPLIPMLRAMAEPDVASSALAEVSESLSRLERLELASRNE